MDDPVPDPTYSLHLHLPHSWRCHLKEGQHDLDNLKFSNMASDEGVTARYLMTGLMQKGNVQWADNRVHGVQMQLLAGSQDSPIDSTMTLARSHTSGYWQLQVPELGLGPGAGPGGGLGLGAGGWAGGGPRGRGRVSHRTGRRSELWCSSRRS